MNDRAKIRLICECGTTLDYLVSRYNLYLVPKCRHCSKALRPTMSDLSQGPGECYKAPKEKTPCVRSC